MQDKYSEIHRFLQNAHVRLVAVSKTKPVESIRQLYDKGQRDFGENKVQELTEKAAQLPADMQWHMIGHLQKNKVKYIAPFIHMIHSVDSMALLAEINKQAMKHKRIISCLLQMHIAKEETKFGMNAAELFALLQDDNYKAMQNIQVAGLMGMATLTDNLETIRSEFRGLHQLFKTVQSTYFADKPQFKEISMGMSSDYIIAVEEGATIVRIGSLIFGERNV